MVVSRGAGLDTGVEGTVFGVKGVVLPEVCGAVAVATR